MSRGRGPPIENMAHRAPIPSAGRVAAQRYGCMPAVFMGR